MTQPIDFAARQQVEGFARLISDPNSHPLYPDLQPWKPASGHDFRGPSPVARTHDWFRPEAAGEPDLVWETAPAPAAVDTTFSFVGESADLPENVYPGNQATLYANEQPVLTFDLGIRQGRRWSADEWALDFAPRQVSASVDGYHRQFAGRGNSGIYRLAAPATALTAGQPLRLKVALAPQRSDVITWFGVRQRTDVLEMTAQTNAEQIAQLQQEIINLKRLVGGLARRAYPELFADRLETEHVIVYTNGNKHVHVPDLVQLQNGDLLVAIREATEHLSNDGQLITVRSKDGGKTWGERQVLREAPLTDERDFGLNQLADGALLCAEWPNRKYDARGFYYNGTPPVTGRKMAMYVGRSHDNGYTWEWPDEPLDPAPYLYSITSEHMVELPSGRLLMANYFTRHGGSRILGVNILASDDKGYTWRELAAPADMPDVSLCEPALERTKSGRLICLMRNQTGPEYYQSNSDDDGATWSPARPCGVTGHANPASLVTLPDGTVLCVHGQRGDPCAMYVVASYDDGATWDMAHRKVIRDDLPNFDMTYPSAVLLPDGRVFTVYYYNMFGRFFIAGDFFRWER
ncbi:MAG: exo-alpha-sialidase [Chloroflexi bacterium]|nr:exo-alpha-sialidase [Chloroflexota bacterium]